MDSLEEECFKFLQITTPPLEHYLSAKDWQIDYSVTGPDRIFKREGIKIKIPIPSERNKTHSLKYIIMIADALYILRDFEKRPVSEIVQDIKNITKE